MEVLLRKRVQEMVLNGEEPPPQYICKESVTGFPVDTSKTSPIPIIDLSLVSSTTMPGSKKEVEKLRSALSSWGCFMAVGHGIPFSLLDGILKVGKDFFELPLEEKNKHAKSVEELQGYGADPPPANGQPLIWQDRLFLDLHPLDKRIPKLWPQTPTSFRYSTRICFRGCSFWVPTIRFLITLWVPTNRYSSWLGPPMQ